MNSRAAVQTGWLPCLAYRAADIVRMRSSGPNTSRGPAEQQFCEIKSETYWHCHSNWHYGSEVLIILLPTILQLFENDCWKIILI